MREVREGREGGTCEGRKGEVCEGLTDGNRRMDRQKDRHTSINHFILKVRELHLYELHRTLQLGYNGRAAGQIFWNGWGTGEGGVSQNQGTIGGRHGYGMPV